jgi:hypothetical protein
MPPARLHRIVGLVVLAAVLAFLVWQLKPGLVFANTTPTGGDLGGHVWAPAALKHQLLPQLSGWSPDWFGGYPAYVLYPVLPALGVVSLSTLLPYGVALKLFVVLAALLLPVAAYLAARWVNLEDPFPALLAIATLPVLFDDSYFKFGGNLTSDILGEFSFSAGLVFALLAIAAIDRLLETNKSAAPAALLSALAALCHPVTGIYVVGAAAVDLALHATRTGVRAVARLMPVALVAALLSAVWYLPFLAYRGELTNLHLPRDGPYLHLLFPLPGWAEVTVAALALGGAVNGVRQRRTFLVSLIGLAFIGALGVATIPQNVLTNGRFLAAWHLGRCLLAGAGAADLLILLKARIPRAQTVGPIVCLVLVTFPIAIITGSLPLSHIHAVETSQGPVTHNKWLFLPDVETGLVPIWASEGFAGYERDPMWPQYRALMTAAGDVGGTLGCGRALAEHDPNGMFGSIYEMALLPYWTDGCISTMTGIPENTSRNTPFIQLADSATSSSPHRIEAGLPYGPLNVPAGVDMLRELGVRYYMAWSDAAKQQADGDPSLLRVATSGPWVMYEVRGMSLVESLTVAPTVAHGPWLDAAVAWFLDQQGPRPVAGGTWSAGASMLPVRVTNVETDGSHVRFHVDQTGVPVLVRVNWFPWWRASGARGPWRIAPNDMVVVPTAHDVTITAAPRTPDQVGKVLTVIGAVGLAGLALRGNPLGGTPLSGTPLSGTPLSGTPLSGTPLSGTPVGGAAPPDPAPAGPIVIDHDPVRRTGRRKRR